MLSPTTELDAINTMLASIGEAPVNAVEDSGVVDAVMARNTLRTVSREVQARGWHYNTEKDYTLTPSFPEKHLVLPRNVLRADTVGSYQPIDVVVRGNRLYDRRRHTFEFDKPVKVDMIVLLDFDELPEAARLYITLRSSRIFQERVVGSADLSQFTMKDELRALVMMQEHEADTADYNMLTDNYAVARVLDR
jgi:hypothetical protein